MYSIILVFTLTNKTWIFGRHALYGLRFGVIFVSL